MKMHTFSTLRVSAAMVALVSALAATPLAAQTKAAVGEGDVIIVTGSRIARPELKASVPVSVINAQSISATGVSNIQDAFKDLPAVGQSLDRTSSNFQNTGNAQATVNLRNLGKSRTLVLINGRRSVGTPGDSSVDLNNIPTDLIDRVEIATGGASAVYGSDAVAGVVNIITKTKFDGLALHAQNMGSDKGDSQNRLITVTAGHSFADDRAHLIAHFSYNTDAGTRSADRDFSGVDRPNRSSFAAQGLFSAAADGAFSAANGATYTFDALNKLKLYEGANVDGYNRAAQRYLSLPVDRYQGAISGDYKFSEMADLYFEGSYTKTKSRASLEALALGNSGPGAVTNFDGTAYDGIPLTSPYVPAGILAAIPAINAAELARINKFNADPKNAANQQVFAPVTTLQFRRRSVDIFSRSNANDRDFYRGVIGLKGEIAKGWSYDLSYEHSEVKDHTFAGGILTGNYGAALSNTTINGQIVCADPAARAAGCVPINIFGFNTVTPAAAAWLQTDPGTLIDPATGKLYPGTGKGQKVSYDYLAKVKQDVAALGLNGKLFNLPGGPIGVALGAEYRKESSTEVFDPYTQFGLSSGNQISNTVGKFNVKEGYIEVVAPILKDIRFIKELTLEGAFRYADYSTVGGVSTYKFGGSYAPSRDIRFRAIYAQAVRAPNISELYSAVSQTFPAIVDPCDQAKGKGDGGAISPLASGCATIPGIANYLKTHPSFAYSTAQIQTTDGLLGGNLNLKPEKTSTLTAGTVITPQFARGLSLTVDYYTIKVKNAIGIIGQQTSVDECFRTGNPLFCSNVIRSATSGFITRVNGLNLNVGSYFVSGLDIGAHYKWNLNTIKLPGSLDLNLLWNHKFKQEQTPFPGGPVQVELGQLDCYSCGRLGTGFKDQASFNAVYAAGPWTLSYRLKYLGPVVDDVTAGAAAVRVSPYFYHNLQASVKVDTKQRFELYVGADNLFDKQPPIFGDTDPVTWPGTATVADTYDTIGRLIYAGVRVKF